MFTVSRDLKQLLSKWWPKFPNRWQCNLNSYSSSQMGLPGLMIAIVGSGPVTTLDTALQMSAMDKEKSHLRLLSFKNINKVPFPKQKTNDSRDKTSQSKRL